MLVKSRVSKLSWMPVLGCWLVEFHRAASGGKQAAGGHCRAKMHSKRSTTSFGTVCDIEQHTASTAAGVYEHILSAASRAAAVCMAYLAACVGLQSC
jgi:hypothetical protein